MNFLILIIIINTCGNPQKLAHEVNSIYYLTAAINIMDIYPSINNLLNTHQLHPSKNQFAYSIISNMINKFEASTWSL